LNDGDKRNLMLTSDVFVWDSIQRRPETIRGVGVVVMDQGWLLTSSQLYASRPQGRRRWAWHQNQDVLWIDCGFNTILQYQANEPTTDRVFQALFWHRDAVAAKNVSEVVCYKRQRKDQRKDISEVRPYLVYNSHALSMVKFNTFILLTEVLISAFTFHEHWKSESKFGLRIWPDFTWFSWNH
jgi:hypothetical protein